MWRGRWLRRPPWDGTTGVPRSANAASSWHLVWEVPRGEWVEAEATLEVTREPVAPFLYFWALQVSFVHGGADAGAAHLGLQWHPPHPGSTAVNWGGYGRDGAELSGSAPSLPSATGNLNTRDFAWHPHRSYRLRIVRGSRSAPSGLTSWRGEVAEVGSPPTVVRELFTAGDRLGAPVVWSEVFAACDAPAAEVCWSALRLVSAAGEVHVVRRVEVSYQALGDGGCANTDVALTPAGVLQRSGVDRSTPGGTRLTLGQHPEGAADPADPPPD